MNIFKKIYCRSFQTVFKIALPFLPYRKPKIISSLSDIPSVLAKKKKGCPLIITDPGIARLGILSMLTSEFDESGITYYVYDKTVANPTTDTVEEALTLYKDNNCDCIIGFGGGSSMDCAKAVGVRIARPNTPLSKLGGILKVHAKDKPLSDDVDLKQIAQNTAGFTGADLENLMNEAAIRAAIGNRKFISNEDIKESFLKIGVGKEKKSKVISDEEKRITAYHEAGHAILFHVLPDMNPVYTISIIPTGMGAAGYTMPQMEKDNIFQTKGRMLQRIIVGLGGRAAEELVFDDVTTGASQDIKQVTAVARAMVTKFGMSEKIGMISYDDDSDEVFIGRDWGHTKSYSEQTASEIDEEVHGIIMRSYDKAKSLIEEHRAVLDETARQLIEKEKLTRAQFEDIFKQLENEN